MKPVKILVTGTFEAGKTTLVEKYKSDDHYFIIPEIARELLQTDSSLQGKHLFQDILYQNQIEREMAAEKYGRPYILCDRGVIDILAYSILLGYELKPEWIKSAMNYDIVCICDYNDVKSDSTNNTYNTEGFREKVDREIRNVVKYIGHINSLPMNIFELSGDIDQRFHLLSSFIERVINSREGGVYNKERR